MSIYIPLLIALLVGSAFFSSSETAFMSVQRVRLEHAVRQGERGASAVADLLKMPGKLLSGILLGNNITNTGAASVGTAIATSFVSGGQAVVLATVTVTVLLVIFSEVIPKTVALQHPLRLAKFYAVPMKSWTVFARPVVWVLDRANRALLELLGAGRRGDQGSLSLGELETAIAMSTESGMLQRGQSSMLMGALELQETPIRRIMTPRADLIVARSTETVEMVAPRMVEASVIRVPVYEDEPDEVIGYLHLRDACRALLEGRAGSPVREHILPAQFEPELAPADEVLERMQEAGAHMVTVVDEHGVVTGLVTVDDLAAEVVGEAPTESGRQAAVIGEDESAQLVVEGRTPLADLGDELGVDLVHPQADTVGGLLVAQLGRLPQTGEGVDIRGVRLTAQEVGPRRVTRVRIEQMSNEAVDSPGESQ